MTDLQTKLLESQQAFDPHTPALVIAIEQAIEWFQGYAENHSAKGTTEGDIRAQTNRDRAAYLSHALNTRAPVAAPTGDALGEGIVALKDELRALRDLMSDQIELNPSNYDHDQVCQLNRQAVEIFSVARDLFPLILAALTGKATT